MIEENIEPGDLVRVHDDGCSNSGTLHAAGETGLVIKMAKRLYIPAAKIMISGEILEYDLDELKLVEKREK